MSRKASKTASAPPQQETKQQEQEPGEDHGVIRRLSAAEQLQQLLPRLTALAKQVHGRAKQSTWRVIYLEMLSHCANVTIAARVAGVSREAVRLAREDKDFVAKEKEAMEIGVDLVEASAFKSAVYGDMEPVYHKGILVGHVVKYSDKMRELLLKGRRPEVYKDKVEHSGELTHTHMTLEEMEQRIRDAQQ